MRVYHITLTGTQPLLMHNDDVEWADRMAAWKDDKNNKKKSKAGDDRSPAFRWIGSLYHDGANIVLPTENIMRACMEGGTMVPVPGQARKTFKAQSQSGMMPQSISWPLLIGGNPVPFGPISDLMSVDDFDAHKARVSKLGFSLFIKRARIGAAKHIRVRPRFDEWAASGTLIVTDDQITVDVLTDILDMAGRYKGLGDWRPSSRTPGTFGMFTAAVERVA